MSEKKQKKLTEKRLENIAVYYLSRYDSSSANLANVLKRRAVKEKDKGAEVPENICDIIQNIIDKMQKAGYVNDERYAENMLRRMSKSGKSRTQIALKAKEKGVDVDLSDFDEEEAAKIFVHKHNLGVKAENFKKDMAKMARAGFSYSAASKSLHRVYDIEATEKE